MPKTKVEVYDKDHLIYPFIESDHVTFSNGMKVSEMLDQSISMPTVVHEDSSFKVGVGNQDVSSAIVDSSVAEMTIKGKTYQNILPEPSTHVLTNNKEMFKVNEGLDPNVEIVDGVSKSAILKGQTLVNAGSYYNININEFVVLNGELSSDGYITMTANGTWVNSFLRKTPLIKPNTKYLVVYEIKENTLERFTIMSQNGTESVFSSYQTTVAPNFTGILKYVATTNNDISSNHILLRDFISNSITQGKIVYRTMVIEYQEGMENWDIPFFRGMSSCKMPVLMTTGKNLCDGQLESGRYAQSEGVPFADNTAVRTVNKIKVKPSTVYTLKIEDGTSLYNTSEYCNGVYIGFKTAGNSLTFTTSPTTNELHLSFKTSNIQLQFQLEEGSQATPYEPYKSNILTVNEDVELHGIGNVKDELNLMTGELSSNFHKITINGASKEVYTLETVSETTVLFTYYDSRLTPASSQGDVNNGVCDKLPYKFMWGTDAEGWFLSSNTDPRLSFRVKKDKLATLDINGLRRYLSENPLTFITKNEKTIKTVDLSSSGNWEKVVLDGSESWQCDANSETGAQVYIPRHQGQKFFNSLKSQDGGGLFHDLKNANYFKVFSIGNNYGMTVVIDKANFPISIDTNITLGEVRELWKQWLSQNPITVWYQTQTHQDSTQVKQPIFFKDGHIIQSSGADNSLIPTLDYQAKTSNSYVMDLMKTNTKYTMKAKTASGTFTIDGTSYGAGTNGTFTTPSSMTNKFLVMSNKTNEEVMILEGDLTSKDIPYFKGIKSAFEDESKIEVLSTGKNLFDKNKVFYGKSTSGNGELIDSPQYVTSDLISVKPNTNYTVKHLVVVSMYDKNGSYIGGLNANHEQRTFTTPSNCSYIRIRNWGLLDTVELQKEVLEKTVLQEGDSIETYEPYKSNSTKIPLLSPLRSLPNGVCDEIILDRENNKAKIIQRVVKIVLNGSEAWYWSKDNNKNSVFYTQVDDILKINGDSDNIISNTFANQMSFNVDREGIWFNSMKYILIGISKEKLNGIITRDEMKRWVSKNPITVHYQLNTPIITEIDLEGFPYVYKDGHIFLNSEIAPTTEIIYSINQCQQISASNEDIIRHEKELTYLQKLIAQYVKVDYESALLSLKV